MREIDIWIAGREERIRKCYQSAGIRIEKAIEENPQWDASEWKIWWDLENKRQEQCINKAIFKYR